MAVTQRVRESERRKEGKDKIVRECEESWGANLNSLLLVVPLMI